METINQDGINYTIDNGLLIGWIGSSKFKKPVYNNGIIEEGWTQSDQDLLDDSIKDQSIEKILDSRNNEGNEYFKKIRNFIKRKYDDGVITNEQFKNIRANLSPALQPLKDGDWDLAQDNINSIQRPSGILSTLYDKVKTDIDTYVAENY